MFINLAKFLNWIGVYSL